MSDGNRPARCHPDRPHHSGGRCMPCYSRDYHERVRKPKKAAKRNRARLFGVVRVAVKGWGHRI